MAIRDRPAILAAVLFLAAPAALAPGCAAPEARRGAPTVGEKLARLGLEVIDPREAPVPAAWKGRAVALRTIPGFPDPALPPDPAGYLIVGVRGRTAGDSSEILEALGAWEPGEVLPVTVLRDPRAGDAGWWQAEVRLALPVPPGRTEGARDDRGR